MGIELEERVRRRCKDDTGDQGRVSKAKTPHRPPGTDRRSIRFGQRFVHAHSAGTREQYFIVIEYNIQQRRRFYRYNLIFIFFSLKITTWKPNCFHIT